MAQLFEDVAPVMPGSSEANDNLRCWLSRQGDFGSTPRTVLHYVYPRDAAARSARGEIAAELRRWGFVTGDALQRDGLVLQHEAAVASKRFDALTADIVDLLTAYGWDYDGWECEVQGQAAFLGVMHGQRAPIH